MGLTAEVRDRIVMALVEALREIEKHAGHDWDRVGGEEFLRKYTRDVLNYITRQARAALTPDPAPPAERKPGRIRCRNCNETRRGCIETGSQCCSACDHRATPPAEVGKGGEDTRRLDRLEALLSARDRAGEPTGAVVEPLSVYCVGGLFCFDGNMRKTLRAAIDAATESDPACGCFLRHVSGGKCKMADGHAGECSPLRQCDLERRCFLRNGHAGNCQLPNWEKFA